jgi:FAST kinase-like protein, subdomain 1
VTGNGRGQEIANTLWSYASLGHDPGNALLDAMAIQMVERIQQFRPQAISNSLWAYAKLGYNPGKELLAVTSRRAQTMLHQYTSQVQAWAWPWGVCPAQTLFRQAETLFCGLLIAGLSVWGYRGWKLLALGD